MEEKRSERPTAEEVIIKLKDDGDFDNLRLQIIRTIKENEELKNKIISEVKQSEIFNQDGSDIMKPGQLTDAVYQELGKKIMGQISDEVWKIIRSESTKNDIRSTVESVYERIVNPKPEKHSPSPTKENNTWETIKSNANDLIKQSGVLQSPANTNHDDKEDKNEKPPSTTMPLINNDNVDPSPDFSKDDNTNAYDADDHDNDHDDDDDDDDLDAPPGFG